MQIKVEGYALSWWLPPIFIYSAVFMQSKSRLLIDIKYHNGWFTHQCKISLSKFTAILSNNTERLLKNPHN